MDGRVIRRGDAHLEAQHASWLLPGAVVVLGARPQHLEAAFAAQ